MRFVRRFFEPIILLGTVALLTSSPIAMAKPKACPGISPKCDAAYDKKIEGKLYSCQKCKQALCENGRLVGNKTTTTCTEKSKSTGGTNSGLAMPPVKGIFTPRTQTFPQIKKSSEIPQKIDR